jgi:hypothetical protein
VHGEAQTGRRRPSCYRAGSDSLAAKTGLAGSFASRFLARWKLGQLLAKVERNAGGTQMSRLGTIGFRDYLAEIGVNKNRANECERIATAARPGLI